MTVNDEIFLNSTFPTAISYSMCPKCAYVYKNTLASNIKCSNCNQDIDTPFMFPDISSYKLLKMIQYFYKNSKTRQDDLKVKIQEDIKNSIGKDYSIPLLVNTAKEIKKYYENHQYEQNIDEKMEEIIKNKLGLKEKKEAVKAFVALFGYSENFYEEHGAVILFTYSLYESLLTELLIIILMKNNKNRQEVEIKVSKMKFDDINDLFLKSIGISFGEALAGFSIKDVAKDYENFKKKRGEFAHGNPYVLNTELVKKSIHLAKYSFHLFAYLQNMFVKI